MNVPNLSTLAALITLIIAGCSLEAPLPKAGNFPPANLSKREISLYRHLVENTPRPSTDQVHFLTLTPISAWGDDGNWHNVPSDFASVIPTGFRSASDARLVDGTVWPIGSEETSVMEWITILRWINDRTAVVEQGSWCCPLGGGATESTYELIDGSWKRTSSGGGWVS
ncbi:MAG: hypothetical protein AAF664_09310 [Planctomycetota bacterium]